MPELPEVETVRRQLAAAVVGMTFLAVPQIESGMLRDCRAEQLEEALPDRRIEGVERKGKFLVLALSGQGFLTLHLGMTGQLIVETNQGDLRVPPWSSAPLHSFDSSLNPHVRFMFDLVDDGGHLCRLRFRDMRKFGRVYFTEGAPPLSVQKLGPDAWLGLWDAGYLADRLRRRTTPLKVFLLDQRHLAGIGNIYADEILWWAKLSPLRPSGSLDQQEVLRLSVEIRRRLSEGVRFLGCTVSDFVDTKGKPGGYQQRLQAYGRRGEPCLRCGCSLVRVVLGGRGTVYCPTCQG